MSFFKKSAQSGSNQPQQPAGASAGLPRPGDALPEAKPGTLDFFLLERYVLYGGTAPNLLRARIHHRHWPLRQATLTGLASTMLEAAGLPTPAGPPLVHAQAMPFDVAVWPPAALRR